MSTVADLNKLKVADLKQELTARGLDIKGNKPDLVARLAAALNTSTTSTPSTPAPSTTVPPTTVPPTTAPPTTAPPTTVLPTTQPTTTQPTFQSEELKQAVPTVPVTPAQTAAIANTPALANQDGGEDAEGEEGDEVDITQMSDAERKRARAERFGIPLQQTEADKKSQRATRFGLGHSGEIALSSHGELKGLVNGDKLEARKKRFGVVESLPSSGIKKSGHHVSVNVPKALRLGIPVKAAGAHSDVDAKKQARLARFGAPVAKRPPNNNADEEKKRKRMERFGGTASGDAGKRLRVDKPLEQQTI
jgi:hypothetical protein